MATAQNAWGTGSVEVMLDRSDVLRFEGVGMARSLEDGGPEDATFDEERGCWSLLFNSPSGRWRQVVVNEQHLGEREKSILMDRKLAFEQLREKQLEKSRVLVRWALSQQSLNLAAVMVVLGDVGLDLCQKSLAFLGNEELRLFGDILLRSCLGADPHSDVTVEATRLLSDLDDSLEYVQRRIISKT
jgi:hypothetical protein